MAEIDTKLKAALQMATRSEMRFAFIAKGGNEGTLLVAKKLSAQEVKEAKEKLKGTAVIRGKCFPQNGLLVFAVKKLTPTLKKQLKKTMLRDAAFNRPFEVREIAELEEEETEEERPESAVTEEPTGAKTSEVPPAPSPPPSEGLEFKQRLQKLMPRYNQAVGAKPANLGAVELALKLASAAARANNFEQAHLQLDRLEEELKSIPVEALEGVPSTPMAPREPAKDDPKVKAEVMKRLGALANKYKTAVAAKGPEVLRMQTLFTTLQRLAKNNDFVQASKILDELEPLVAGALSSAKGDKPTTDKVEEQKEEKKPAPAVVFQQSRLIWEAARKKVQSELQALEKAILAECAKLETEESEDEIDMGELAARTKELYKVLDKLDTRLIDKLDEALNAADPNERQARQKEAGAIVKEYINFVTSDPLMTMIDNNGFTSSKIQADVLKALKGLASKL